MFIFVLRYMMKLKFIICMIYNNTDSTNND